jgi:hypothetical protein
VSGGRRASLPPPDWAPPSHLPAEGGTAVRFTEQSGAKSKVFDFANLRTRAGEPVPVEAGVQQWFARVFARRTGPRSGVTRLAGAAGVYASIARLAAVLAAADPPVEGPQDVRPAHIRAAWARHAGWPSHRLELECLRALPSTGWRTSPTPRSGTTSSNAASS